MDHLGNNQQTDHGKDGADQEESGVEGWFHGEPIW
jgi:hypothetical protein